MTWELKTNLRGPAGFNATDAAGDDAAIAAFLAGNGTAARAAAEALVRAQYEKGTPVGSPPVVKPTGDGRAGVWEYTHNDTTGYLYHLLMGAGTASGAWAVGIGVDSGLGNGVIIRNKAKGIGLKIEQLTSITSATAYGLTVEQKSALAPAILMSQASTGTAMLMDLQSFVPSTDPNALILRISSGSGTAGFIKSYSGEFVWDKKFTMRTDVGADFRSNTGKADEWAKHLIVNHNGLEFQNPGAASSWNMFRISTREGGEVNRLNFQTAPATADPSTAVWSTVIGLRHNQLGFYGAAPVSKPALTYSRTGESAAAAALRGVLVSLGLVTDSTVA